MSEKFFGLGRKCGCARTALLCFILLILIFPLLTSGCYKGTDPKLPEEYYGTSWICTDLHAVINVDDEGNCFGLLTFKDVTLPIKFCFREDLSRRSGRTQFFVNDEGPGYHLFSGEFEVTGDTMVITGTWSEFMETIYHQPYDPGEYTLIFERRQ